MREPTINLNFCPLSKSYFFAQLRSHIKQKIKVIFDNRQGTKNRGQTLCKNSAEIYTGAFLMQIVPEMALAESFIIFEDAKLCGIINSRS